jgi:hypothetical protein
LQTSSMEEQLVQTLPARMNLCRDWAGHSTAPRQPDTRRDCLRSANSGRQTAAAPVLIGDGFCIPSRSIRPPAPNPEKSRHSHQLPRIVPCRPSAA